MSRGFAVRAVLVAVLLLGAASTGLALSGHAGNTPPKPPPTSGPPKPPAPKPPPAPQPQPGPTSGGKPPGHPNAPGARRGTPGLGANVVDMSSGCTTTPALPAEDDGPSIQYNIGFPINFFGTTYSAVWVNNNGNLTFDGALTTYTPFDLSTTGTKIIAPFFADVDTGGAGNGHVYYGTTTFQGHAAFCATWVGVGYYSQHADKLNTFQVLIVQRLDQDTVGNTGHFNIVFNYDQVQWETGDASNGHGGLGGSSAVAGYSSGNSGDYSQLPGSGVPGSFLDSNPNGLASRSNDGVPGQDVISGPTIVGAPLVTIDSTVPTTIGSGDSSTVTFKATTDGTYSTRVGGTDCSTGQQIDSGSYPTANTDATTIVNAADLAAGANTIRVCVTNDVGTGDATTTITETAPPVVTIDSTDPTTIGPNDSSTITWHADQNGSFQVLLGSSCTDEGATILDSGSYTSSPDTTTSNVDGSALSDGDNSVYVCVTNDSNLTSSDSTSVKLLGIPTPLAPDNASTITGNQATIGWTSIHNGTGYQLELVQYGEGCDFNGATPIDISGKDTTSYDTGPLDPGHYCWQVQAVDGDGVSGYGTVFEFYVAPSAPSLTYPPDGSSTNNNDPTFTWSGVSGATGYEIQVFSGNSCSGEPQIDETPSTNSFTPPGTLSDGTYCWQVASTAGGAESAFSAPSEFTVDTDQPNVVVDSTNPGTIGPSDTSTVTWHAGEAGTYTVLVGGAGLCEDGTVVDSGTYSSPPDTVQTIVHGSDLLPGDNTVHVCVTDPAGNVGQANTTVTLIVDNTQPTVNVPDPITAEATSSAGAAVDFTVTATDTDPGDTAGAPTCDHNSGDTFPLGTTTVHCQSTDLHEKTGYGQFDITVQDTTPPAITTPGDQVAEATGPSGAVVTYSAPTATDLVDGTDPVNCTPAAGSTFALGHTTVNCSSTDAHSNTGHASFDVLVHDTTPPDLTVPADFSVEATGPGGATVDYTASATDLVDPSPSVTCNPPSGSNFFIRVTPVTCTATDASGNSVSKTFHVTVQDTTPPTLKVPSDISVETSGSSAVVTYSASAKDVADPSPSLTCSPASGSTFPLGTTKVTCTAKDASGNSASKSFNVTVTQAQAPASPPPAAPPPPPPPPTPPPTPPTLPPTDAKQVNAQPVPGKPEPKVKLPGSHGFVPLSEAKNLPAGTTITVNGGAQIDLSDPKGNEMVFYGDNDGVPSTFIFQGTKGGVVQLSLTGGNLPKFRTTSGLAAKSKKPVRRLWGSGHGKFTTKGKYASATVRGTIWLVADYSDHTLVTVKRGLVAVQDFVTNKTVLVKAGHSVIVRSKTKTK